MKATLWWRVILAVGTLLVPIILITWVFDGGGQVDLPAIMDPKAENYPDAVERLEATSQTLTTVILAILAATGVIVMREKPPTIVVRIGAAAIFTLSVASMFYATKLGHAAALTLASGRGDITPLAAILDTQAMYTLLSGVILGALVAGGGTESQRP